MFSVLGPFWSQEKSPTFGPKKIKRFVRIVSSGFKETSS